MTAAAVEIEAEITELTELDPEKQIPCEVRTAFHIGRHRLTRWFYCGKPSSARMLVHCGACGGSYRMFLCRGHVKANWAGSYFCRLCHKEGTCVLKSS